MLRVTTEFSGAAQGTPYFSTTYTGGTTQEDADAAVAAVDAWWTALQPITSTNLNWDIHPEVESVLTSTGQTDGIFGTAGGQGTGTGVGEEAPWATQGLVRWRTGVFTSGREIRGRTFLPGIREASNVDGRPASTYISDVNTAAAGLISALSTAGSMGVYSVTHRVFAVIQSASTWNQWAILRSRRD